MPDMDSLARGHNTDALAWAEAFIEQWQGEVVGEKVDVDYMLGVFANAIETGRSAGLARARSET